MMRRRDLIALVMAATASGLAAVVTLGEALAVSVPGLLPYEQYITAPAIIIGVVLVAAVMLVESRGPYDPLVVPFVSFPTVGALAAMAIALMLRTELPGAAPPNSLWMCFGTSLVFFAVQLAVVVFVVLRASHRRSVL